MTEHKIKGLELICAKEERGELYWHLINITMGFHENPSFDPRGEIDKLKKEYNLTEAEAAVNWYRMQLHLLENPQIITNIYKHGPPLYYIRGKND